MKICNILFSDKKGGVEEAFINYTKAISMENDDIYSIINDDFPLKNLLTGKIFEVKVNCSFFQNRNKNFFLGWIYKIKSAISLAIIIQKIQPDIIISHGKLDILRIKLAMIHIFFPIISVCHGYSYRKKLQGEYTIIINQKMREFIKQKPENILFCPNPVNIFENENFFTLGTCEFQNIKNSVIIGSIGRIVKDKNFESIIQAAKILQNNNIDVEVKIAGDGENLQNLKILSNELGVKAEFLGWVKGKEKENFFKSINVFCIASVAETFGIVIVEAMSVGLPIIATETAGAESIIQNYHNGILLKIDKNLPENIAKSIEFIIANKGKTQQMIKNAIESSHHYSISSIGKILNNYFEKICSNKISNGKRR